MTTNGRHPKNANGRHGDAIDPTAAVQVAAFESAGVSAADAIDAIELPESDPRRRAVMERLDAAPALRDQLAALRDDRAALTRIGVKVDAESMLADAIDAAEAQAERAALLHLERVDPDLSTPPVSRVVPPRRPVIARLGLAPVADAVSRLGGPSAVWLGLAATLLLVVSAGATLLADRLGILIDAPERFAANTPERNTTIADATPTPGDATDPAAGVPTGPAALPTSPPAFTRLAGLGSAERVAQAGQLAMIVSGPRDAFAGLARADGPWSLAVDAPSTVVAALPVALGAPAAAGQPVEVVAGEDPAIGVPPTSAQPPTPRVALARVSPNRTALTAFVARFEEAGCEVEFVELADPVEAPMDLSPSAIAWWGTSPTSWPDRAAVPIVFQPTD